VKVEEKKEAVTCGMEEHDIYLSGDEAEDEEEQQARTKYLLAGRRNAFVALEMQYRSLLQQDQLREAKITKRTLEWLEDPGGEARVMRKEQKKQKAKRRKTDERDKKGRNDRPIIHWFLNDRSFLTVFLLLVLSYCLFALLLHRHTSNQLMLWRSDDPPVGEKCVEDSMVTAVDRIKICSEAIVGLSHQQHSQQTNNRLALCHKSRGKAYLDLGHPSEALKDFELAEGLASTSVLSSGLQQPPNSSSLSVFSYSSPPFSLSPSAFFSYFFARSSYVPFSFDQLKEEAQVLERFEREQKDKDARKHYCKYLFGAGEGQVDKEATCLSSTDYPIIEVLLVDKINCLRDHGKFGRTDPPYVDAHIRFVSEALRYFEALKL